MIYPILNTYESPKYPVKGFYGINRKKKASVGECVDCLNINGDEFPVLRSVRGNDGIIHSESEITKILPPESGAVSLSGIIGGEVCVSDYDQATGEMGRDERPPIDILKIGDVYITLPSLMCYNQKLKTKSMRPTKEYLCYEENSKDFFRRMKLYSPKAYENFEIGQKIIYIKMNNFEWSASEDNYFIISDKVSQTGGKYVELSYLKKDGNGIFQISTNEELEGLLDDYSGTGAKFLMISEAEDIKLACVLNNRVWGVTSDGRQIRCSKLGEPNVFSSYNDGAASSWFCEVGSEGKFTGIIPYNNAIFAFKESCVHVVYGTIPQNFSLEKTFEECGCIDGKSIQIVNNVLYWLGYNGIYRYAGGTPKVISDNLNKKYKACVSFTDNEKLYLNLTDLDGNKEFFSYDTKNGLWHKYTYLDVLGGFLYDGNLYAYTKNDIYKMFSGDFGEWNFTGVLEYNDNLQNNSTTDLYIMAEMKAGSEFTVEYKGISESDWEYCGKYVADKDCVIKEHFKMRVRHDSAYNLRISGNGEAYIYEMLKTTPGSGFKEI